MTIKLCSDLAKANVKAKIVFDVCRLFFDHFFLFFDLFRFRLVLTGPMRGSYCLVNFYCYRPQRSCGKVMFSQASVILSMRGGVPGRLTPWADTRHTPLGRHPLWEDPPGQTCTPCPVHAGIYTPLPSACWDTHPLPSACWDTPPPPDSHCSGWYASYWNAFLLVYCNPPGNSGTFLRYQRKF